jgi:hypothetical protein
VTPPVRQIVNLIPSPRSSESKGTEENRL